MECQECRELISAYVDDMVSPQEEKQIMSHLEKCTFCQEAYEALKQMKQMCNQIKEIDVPEGFHQELMKRVKQEAGTKTVIPMKKHWKWQYSGALVATLFVGGVLMYQLGRMGNPLEHAITTQESSGDNYGITMARSVEGTPVENGQEEFSKQRREVLDQEMEESVIDNTISSQDDSMFLTVYVEDCNVFEERLEAYLQQQGISFVNTQPGYEIEVDTFQDLKEWLLLHSLLVEGIQQEQEMDRQCPLTIELTIEKK